MNLNWQASKTVFQDPRKKMMYASANGNFTREQIKDKLHELSTGLRNAGKVGKIGVSYRYQESKRWAPAVLNEFGNDLIFDDTYDEEEEDDRINYLQFYVINQNDANHQYHRGAQNRQLGFNDYFG